MQTIKDVGVYKPETTREVTMEDIDHALVAFYDALQSRGINFTSVEEDNKFHDNFMLYLEETFKWPEYTSFN
jgi:hypothetical protein